MSAPVPRCGRMDPHERHEVTTPASIIDGRPTPAGRFICLGQFVHEGGARCFGCSCVVCRCEEKAAVELARERHEEWWAE